MRKIISKYKNSLRQHFDQLPSKYEGLLQKNQIIETFEFMVDNEPYIGRT